MSTPEFDALVRKWVDAADFVYFIQEGAMGPIKIGYATGDPIARLLHLQMGNPTRLYLRLKLNGSKREEAKLHSLFAANHIRGEWFRPSDELLTLVQNPPDDLATFLGTQRQESLGRPPGLYLVSELQRRPKR